MLVQLGNEFNNDAHADLLNLIMEGGALEAVLAAPRSTWGDVEESAISDNQSCTASRIMHCPICVRTGPRPLPVHSTVVAWTWAKDGTAIDLGLFEVPIARLVAGAGH